MSKIPDKKGYVLLWRKTWECEVLKERGKRFSKVEAWLYIVSVMARGTDNCELKRGEFEASSRYLAKAFNWSTSSAFRFLQDLQKGPEPMIKKVEHQVKHLAERFTICKYDTYNQPWNTSRNTSWNEINTDINTVQNKQSIRISKYFLLLRDGTTYQVPEDAVERYRSTYPGLDVDQNMMIMVSWCKDAKPSDRKTRVGITRFINGWLAREFKNTQGMNVLKSLSFGDGGGGNGNN
jgi:hypothetical protein